MFCLSFYHVFLFYVSNKPLDIRKPVAPRGLLQNPYLGIICIGCNVSRRTTICMCYRHHSSRAEITILLLEFWGLNSYFSTKSLNLRGYSPSNFSYMFSISSVTGTRFLPSPNSALPFLMFSSLRFFCTSLASCQLCKNRLEVSLISFPSSISGNKIYWYSCMAFKYCLNDA